MFKIFILLLIILFPFGCGDNLSKSTKDESATLSMSVLNGIWNDNNCNLSSSTVSPSYKISILFAESGDNATSTTTHFSDSNCTNATWLFKEKVGSISFQGKTTLSDSRIVTKYSAVIVDITITPLTSDKATYFNDSPSTCGINTWSANTETSIAGKTCNTTTYPSINSGYKDILQMNSEKSYIKTGNVASTLDSNGYPINLYSNKYYKQ